MKLNLLQDNVSIFDKVNLCWTCILSDLFLCLILCQFFFLHIISLHFFKDFVRQIQFNKNEELKYWSPKFHIHMFLLCYTYSYKHAPIIDARPTILGKMHSSRGEE